MSNYSYVGLQGFDFKHPYDFKDKDRNISMYIRYMLSRTQSMFEYENLPESIPARNLELMLQCNGNVAVASVEGTLYAFTGGLGGVPDPYYMPTVYTVANPALKFNKNLSIGDECIVILNDSMYLGLLPMFKRYATSMVENDLTINLVDIVTRAQALISAADDRTKASAEEYIRKLVEGEIGIIGEEKFMTEGLTVQPYFNASSGSRFTELLELQQYLKSAWFNELGLHSNYNMKREALNSAETQLDDDVLIPLVDDMLKQRETGLEKVNDLFGTDISVKLSSAWEDNVQEIELAHEELASEADGTETEESEEPEESETEEIENDEQENA